MALCIFSICGKCLLFIVGRDRIEGFKAAEEIIQKGDIEQLYYFLGLSKNMISYLLTLCTEFHVEVYPLNGLSRLASRDVHT